MGEGVSTAWLKLVDPWATPGAVGAGRLAAWARSRAKRSPSPLVIRPGGMGDLIVLHAAAEHLGLDAVRDLCWLIERRSALWAESQGLPHFCYDRAADVARLWKQGPWPVVVNTEQRHGLSQAAATSLAAPGALLACFATNRAAAHANVRADYDSRSGFEGDAFAALLAQALGRSSPAPMKLRSRRHPAVRRPILALAGNQVPSRALSPEDYAFMIRKWFGNDQAVDIAFAPADRRAAEQVRQALPGDSRLLDGPFSRLVEEVAGAECLATMDGGMVHVASYFGVPVKCVFTSGIASKWRPWSEGSEVWSVPGLKCQPCCHFGEVPPCPHQFACKNTRQMVRRQNC